MEFAKNKCRCCRDKEATLLIMSRLFSDFLPPEVAFKVCVQCMCVCVCGSVCERLCCRQLFSIHLAFRTMKKFSCHRPDENEREENEN